MLDFLHELYYDARIHKHQVRIMNFALVKHLPGKLLQFERNYTKLLLTFTQYRVGKQSCPGVLPETLQHEHGINHSL